MSFVPAHTSSISFGHAQAPGGKVPKKPSPSKKPVSLAAYTAAPSAPKAAPVPLSAFGFANKFATSNDSVAATTSTGRSHVRSKTGIIHDHDKNAESSAAVDPRVLEQRGRGATLGGVLGPNNRNNESAPAAPTGPMRRHIEHHDHLTLTSEGVTHTTREPTTGRGHSARQADSYIGDMLGGHSTIVPPAPRPHHRAPHHSTESNLVSVGGILTHTGAEQGTMARMHNIHSGECSIGDMLGGHSTAPPETARHHHKSQHNTSESHMGGIFNSGLPEHSVVGQDKRGTVFGDKPELLHKKHIVSSASASQMGFCLDQASDKRVVPVSRNNSFRSSGSMCDIMTGAPLAVHENEAAAISARKAKHLDKTNSNFQGSMSSVLSNANGQRSARGATSHIAAPRKGGKSAQNNSSSIVLG